MAIPSWLHLSQVSGSGDTVITITADTNSAFVGRSVDLIVSGITKFVEVEVEQVNRIPNFTINPDSMACLSAGTTFNITVEAEKEWSATCSANWISFSPSSGVSGTTTVQATVGTYTEGGVRSGVIHFTDGFTPLMCTITQAGKDLDVDVQDLCYSYRFNLVREINVFSFSSGWTVTSKPDWISVGPKSGGTGNTTVTVIANAVGSPYNNRSGNIVISNGTETKTIPVLQKRDDVDIASSARLSWFKQSGGTKTFRVNSATTTSDWTVTSDSSWLTITPTSGACGTTVYITVTTEANNNFESRVGLLTFTCMDTGTEWVQWVTQPGTDESGKYLYYKSTNGAIVKPDTAATNNWGVTIVSNTYENGQGLITFSEPISCIISSAFFRKYTLSEIVIPSTVKTIGSGAFDYDDALSAITVPSSVEYVGSNAFYDCYGLREVSLPSVTVIGDAAFDHCTGVTSYSFPNLVEVGQMTFRQVGPISTFVLPDTFRKFRDIYTFASCYYGLEHITIPEGVQDLPETTFYQCHVLLSVSLPSTTRSIGGSAFYETWVMTDLYIHARKAPAISDSAFNLMGYKSGRNPLYTSGVLHYPAGSDYSYIISKLPGTWTAVADL